MSPPSEAGGIVGTASSEEETGKCNSYFFKVCRYLLVNTHWNRVARNVATITRFFLSRLVVSRRGRPQLLNDVVRWARTPFKLVFEVGMAHAEFPRDS